MLTGLAASSEYTSKEIGELKDAISKLDSEVAAGHTRATEGLSTSGTAVASLSQASPVIFIETAVLHNFYHSQSKH